MFKKMLFIIVGMFTFILAGCGANDSVLLDEYYSAINWKNNQEEIELLVSKLDDKRFEVTTEDSKVTVVDKEIDSMDKLEYTFEDDSLVEVKLRSNSKEVSCKSIDTIIYYYINDSDEYVVGLNTQKTYLSGQKFFEEEIDTRNKEMLEIYFDIPTDYVVYQTRAFFEEYTNTNIKYEMEELGQLKNEESILTLIDKTDGSKIVVDYDDNVDGSLPIESIKYFEKSGKVIETVVKDSKIVAFKNYLTEDSVPTDVSTFSEQGAFLINRAIEIKDISNERTEMINELIVE